MVVRDHNPAVTQSGGEEEDAMGRTMVAVVSALFALSASTGGPRAATHVSAADVATMLEHVPPRAVSDQQVRMVDAGGYNVGVGVVYRPQAADQKSIEHDKLTEVYYVLEGAGTLVTGGSLVDPRPLPPTSAIYRELAGPSALGTAIQGGDRRRIGVGDVVIIPAGVPHWFSDVQGSIKYLVFRVDPERLLAAK
jgi:mannose-6-phosphate isomerase-like protein (cupin superfamily)